MPQRCRISRLGKIGPFCSSGRMGPGKRVSAHKLREVAGEISHTYDRPPTTPSLPESVTGSKSW